MRPPTSGLDVVIDRNRHSRSNSDRILNLLNDKDPGPALTKARKPEIHQPPPQMDHFYIAKLLLHGLKPLKSKQAATKKALLAALQWVAGLTVPETILKFERDLAAERLQRRSIRSRNRFERGQKRKKERSARGTDEDDLLADVQAPRQRGIQVDQGFKAPRHQRSIRGLPHRRTGLLKRLGLLNAQIRLLFDIKARLGCL